MFSKFKGFGFGEGCQCSACSLSNSALLKLFPIKLMLCLFNLNFSLTKFFWDMGYLPKLSLEFHMVINFDNTFPVAFLWRFFHKIIWINIENSNQKWTKEIHLACFKIFNINSSIMNKILKNIWQYIKINLNDFQKFTLIFFIVFLFLIRMENVMMCYIRAATAFKNAKLIK